MFALCLSAESLALVGKLGGGYACYVLKYLTEVGGIGKPYGYRYLLYAVRACEQKLLCLAYAVMLNVLRGWHIENRLKNASVIRFSNSRYFGKHRRIKILTCVVYLDKLDGRVNESVFTRK